MLSFGVRVGVISTSGRGLARLIESGDRVLNETKVMALAMRKGKT